MNYELFSNLYQDCTLYNEKAEKNKELYTHERGYQDWMDDYTPEGIISILESIWELYWMNVKEMRLKLNISQQAMSDRYMIPKRTIENWETDSKAGRNISSYQKMLIAYSIFESERIDTE